MILFSFSSLTVQSFKVAFLSESHLPMGSWVVGYPSYLSLFSHLENKVNNGYLKEFFEIRNYLCKTPPAMPGIQQASNKW